MNVIDMKKLISAAQNFYNGRSTGMSDFEYDQLMKSMPRNFSIYEHIKYESDGERGVHTISLPVFTKRTDMEELGRVVEEQHLVVTPKFDGSSIVAYYDETGKLQNILSRSDEHTGITQTEKLRHKVPATVNPEVRAILFEATNKENRAKANGLINSKYKQDEVNQFLILKPFDVILRKRVLGYQARFDLAGVVPFILDQKEIDFIVSQNGGQEMPRLSDETPVDGFVLYSNVNPQFGPIFKFYGTLEGLSIVRKLKLQPADTTGIVHIVVNFDEVNLGGTKVKNASAGSYAKLLEKEIGVGSEVTVILSKVTIPKIIANTKYTTVPDLKCPRCGSQLVPFGANLVCSNISCVKWDEIFLDRLFVPRFDTLFGKTFMKEFTVSQPYDVKMLKALNLRTKMDFKAHILNPEILIELLLPMGLGSKTEDFKSSTLARMAPGYTSLKQELLDYQTFAKLTPSQRDYVNLLVPRFIDFLRRLK